MSAGAGDGYNSPREFTLNAGETVLVEVSPLGNDISGTGTYAIRYYE
jgi:hypothetical protein